MSDQCLLGLVVWLPCWPGISWLRWLERWSLQSLCYWQSEGWHWPWSLPKLPALHPWLLFHVCRFIHRQLRGKTGIVALPVASLIRTACSQTCQSGKYQSSSGYITSCTSCEACPHGEVRIGCGEGNAGVCQPCLDSYIDPSNVYQDTCRPCAACAPGFGLSGCGGKFAGECTVSQPYAVPLP